MQSLSTAPDDLDHIYDDGLMSSLRAIVLGKELHDGILFGSFGQSSTVGRSLSLAARHLDSPLHAEDGGLADRACCKVGIKGSSKNHKDLARAILRAMVASNGGEA